MYTMIIPAPTPPPFSLKQTDLEVKVYIKHGKILSEPLPLAPASKIPTIYYLVFQTFISGQWAPLCHNLPTTKEDNRNIKHGSRINTDRFSKRVPGEYGVCSSGIFFYFNSPKFPFHSHTWPDFNLENFIFFKYIYLFIKNLTGFRKTVPC